MAGPGSGHNHGPTLEGGRQWRQHCWRKARRDLIPHLPIEILRGRVARAKELGLDYKTYASVRASTGRDVIGFLFSSNALRAFQAKPSMPGYRVEKLAALERCARIAIVSRPLTPDRFLAKNPASQIDRAMPAPNIISTWPQCRLMVQSALAGDKLPADGIILIGDTTLERDWSEAGRLAGYLTAGRYFQDA